MKDEYHSKTVSKDVFSLPAGALNNTKIIHIIKQILFASSLPVLKNDPTEKGIFIVTEVRRNEFLRRLAAFVTSSKFYKSFV